MRSSRRNNKGVPPDRYGFSPERSSRGSSERRGPASLLSLGTSVTTQSTSSSLRRQRLKAEAELEAAKKLQVLEETEAARRLERQKEIVNLELKSTYARIDEAPSSSRRSHRGRDSRYSRVTPSEKLTRTAEWVASVEQQSEAALVEQAPVEASDLRADASTFVPAGEPQMPAYSDADLVTEHSISRSSERRRPEDSASSHDDLVRKVQDLTREMDLKDKAFQHALSRTVTATARPAEQRGTSTFLARQTVGRDLPTFSGQPEEWPLFISIYRSSSHECQFTAAENLIRLQKCLRGKAKEAVMGLLAIPGSAEEVLRTLEMRFGRADLVVGTLVAKAKAFSTIRQDDFESLIAFATAVQTLVSTMKLLRESGHMSNPQLRQELVAKLPATLRLQWGNLVQTAKPGDTNISSFSAWLQGVAQAAANVHTPRVPEKTSRKPELLFTTTDAERSTGPVKVGKQAAKPTNQPSAAKPTNQSSATKPTSSSMARLNVSTRKCSCCDSDRHQITECPRFGDMKVKDRWELVKEKKCCFSCLGSNHRVSDCPDRKDCPATGCQKKHHQLLHYEPHNSTHNPNLCTAVEMSAPPDDVLLRVAPVTIRGPSGDVQATALFDEASTVTLIDTTLATAVGATGPVSPLTLSWTNKQKQNHAESQCIDLQIAGDSGEMFPLKRARTVDELQLPCSSAARGRTRIADWEHLAHVPISEVKERPKLLIGQDNINLTVSREVVEGPVNAPIASRTLLGWVIHGSIGLARSRVDTGFTLCTSSREDELLEMVKQSFRTDNFGVSANATPLNAQQQRASHIQEETTSRTPCGTRWETGLLWKTDSPVMPPSKAAALTRLESLERKMSRMPDFAEQYTEKVEQYIAKRYAEKLTPAQAAEEPPHSWYLPHFGVTNPNKPGKLRLVFDAASKTGGRSLNDALLSGPDLLRPLPTVLFGFRERKIAFGGDIAEMFHQIDISSTDRCSQRFLWRTDPEAEPDTYQMRVMTFGATSSPSSALFVKNHNAKHHPDTTPRLQKAIEERHYMDDYFDSTDTVSEAVTMTTGVTKIHQDGGFMIRHWISNSDEVIQSIPEELRATSTTVGLDVDRTNNWERTLGLHWDTVSDTLRVQPADSKLNSGNGRTTKRNALSKVMAVFDPLGLLACFTVRARILLQDIWRSGIGWDDELPSSSKATWDDWCQELQQLNTINIPRCYSVTVADATDIQLHVFCDASEKAFGAAVYWRFLYKDGSVSTSLVAAKTRVAPLKPLSIPRLELQAAILGARLMTTVRAHHSYESNATFMWSDSQTVLCWIRSDARTFKPFVAHRVGEIKELTDEDSWRWVPTADNVADDLTRGTPVSELNSNRWQHGPDFLQENPGSWPAKTAQEPDPIHANHPEMKQEFCANTTVVSTVKHALPEVNRFSTWIRLVRATAWVLRFINNLKARIGNQQPTVTELLPSEFKSAERLWWQEVQSAAYPEELWQLQNGKPISPSSKLSSLALGLKDGLIVVSGRTDDTPHLAASTKHPVLLDSSHAYTKLLIMQFHVWSAHQGQEQVRNDLRQQHWIPRARAAVRQAWSTCQRCRNLAATPQIPVMAPLPECRSAAFERPFTHTGVDYFGPIEVVVGRRREKRYGVLFTCLTVRAIHLEIAASLTTDSCIMAIRRMIARRGYPAVLYSDNGTNFRGADRELTAAIAELDQPTIMKELTVKNIEWKFNPPAAPHMGGAWERLVRSVKVALKATLKERTPRDEVLTTVMAEAECIVNGRPLTHVSIDHADAESLTPNHFLVGGNHRAVAPGVFNETCLRKQWRISQALSKLFWRHWVKEYLPSLSRRTKWNRYAEPVKVDDVVVIADPQLSRSCWPKGVIEATHPGRDGVTRVVDVRTAMGTFRRPVSRICVLDVK